MTTLRRIVAGLSGIVLLAAPSLAADGLIACSNRPLAPGGVYTVAVAPNVAALAEADLKAFGLTPVTAPRAGMSFGDLVDSVVFEAMDAVAFYDVNVSAVSQTVSLGERGQRFGIALPHCAFIAERAVCDGFLPCG